MRRIGKHRILLKMCILGATPGDNKSTWVGELGPSKRNAALDARDGLLQLGLSRASSCKKPNEKHTVNFTDVRREIRDQARKNTAIPLGSNGPTNNTNK